MRACLFTAQKYDLTLYLDDMYPMNRIDRALQHVPGVRAHESWILATGSVSGQQQGLGKRFTPSKPEGAASQSEKSRGVPFTAIAMPPDSHLFAPVMAMGRSLEYGDTNSVVLNPALAAQIPQIHVGDDIRLHIGALDHTWHVVGICRALMMEAPTAYLPFSSLDVIDPQTANVIQIAVTRSNGTSLELAREQIDPNLDREAIRVSGGRSTTEFHSAVDQHILMIYVFLVIASGIVGGVGGIGLMTTMGINVLERRPEIGILRAIGAGPMMISAIVIGEAATIAVIAWAGAALLSLPLAKVLAVLIGRMLHVEFEFRIASLGMAGVLGLSLVAAVLASVVAVDTAVRLTVREALTYE